MQKQITALLDETRQIVHEVRQSNWDVVQHLAEQRQKHLEDFFAQPIPLESADQVADMTRQILDFDKHALEAVHQEKSHTLNAFREVQNQNQAKKAYQHIASMTS